MEHNRLDAGQASRDVDRRDVCPTTVLHDRFMIIL